MKINQLPAFLFMIILVLSCGQEEEKNGSKPNPFAGLWSLYIMEQQDSSGNWNEWRDGMQGYLMYNEQNTMAVHLTTKGYQDTDLRFPNFNDTISIEALKHLTKTYTYFAKYTVNEEESTVEHARISHSNPGDWNEVVVRKYTFSGDTLILAPLEEETKDLRLKWIKQQ